MQAGTVKSNFTAFENQFWQDPGAGNTAAYANFAAWNTAWTTDRSGRGGGENLYTITKYLTAMPGTCVVLRNEGMMQVPETLTEVQLGPATQGSVNWSTDPFPYSLTQLKATNKICGTEQRDEGNAGFGGNPIFSMKFSDHSIGQIVCKSNVCMAYPGTGTYPASSIFGNPQTTVFVRNATHAALNGSHTVACSLMTNWSAWFYNNAYCVDPSTGSAAPDAFTFNTSGVADGTYTAGTDASLEILGWATYVGYTYDGHMQLPNNAWQYVIGKFRAAGIPQQTPIIGNAAGTTALFWQSAYMADYHTSYPIFSQAAQGFPWGPNFTGMYHKHYNAKWGAFNFYGARPYWQTNGTGYVTVTQNTPQVIAVGTSAVGMAMGGAVNTISSMSGSTLTTATPHNVQLPAAVLYNKQKAVISDNSDSKMNGHWLVYPTGKSTLQVFSPSGGIPGCAQSGALGTLTIRGVAYAIITFGTPIVLSTNAPTDLAPGELLTTSGVGGSGCNVTEAFLGYGYNQSGTPIYTGILLAPLANSSGTGGTLITYSGQGTFDALHDYNQNSGARLEGFSAELLFAAGEGYVGMRIYQSTDVLTLLNQWDTYWPNDGQFIQVNPEPYTNQPLDLQQRWWSGAPGLALLKRLASFYLQQLGPSPWIAPGPPYIVTTLETSSAYGNILNVWNASEIQQTVSVPLGTYCQVGTNPISVYEVDYPHSTTNLLTGVQTNYTLTMNPGEIDVFACHAGAASFVQPVSFAFTAPAGTSATAIQVVYGNYKGPLSSYARSASGSSSPIILNLDSGWSDVWFRFQYLNSSNVVIGSSDFERIPQH